ncbi:MAG: hypothetical protein ACRDT1_15440, partial [Micromonosporaceae bacterium]
ASEQLGPDPSEVPVSSSTSESELLGEDAPTVRRASTLRLVLINVAIFAPLWVASYVIGANL